MKLLTADGIKLDVNRMMIFSTYNTYMGGSIEKFNERLIEHLPETVRSALSLGDTGRFHLAAPRYIQEKGSQRLPSFFAVIEFYGPPPEGDGNDDGTSLPVVIFVDAPFDTLLGTLMEEAVSSVDWGKASIAWAF